ncbi:MAG: hypothetical protein ABIL62_19225 [Planctomycetota bacterium]
MEARRKATQQRWVPIETRRWRVKPLLVAGRGIDTSIDNLKRKLQ